MTKNTPVIGTLFSSDSSDSDFTPRKVKTSASETEKPKKIRMRVNLTSAGERSEAERKPAVRAKVEESIESPDGYVVYDKTRIGLIKPNTLIQYEKTDGKIIKPKYFKKCDNVAGTIIVGFYTHNKRNYPEQLLNIKHIFVQSTSIGGGADALKDTIEIQLNQIKTLRRDMIITYEKQDGEHVFRCRFNAFIKGSDGATRLSLTSERGFNFTTDPSKITKLYRHLTSNDKTLTFILEAMRKMDSRIKKLEQQLRK